MPSRIGKHPTLTPERRMLMHMLMDGDHRVVTHLFQIQMYVRCDEILRWLIDNRITGSTFIDWFEINHKSSPLKMVGFVINAIEKRRKGVAKRQLYGHDLVEG